MNTIIFEKLMKLIVEAERSKDIPVAAIITNANNEILFESYNNKIKTKNISGHAEINVINQAIQELNYFNLEDYILYTTLEPCGMCYNAIWQAKIKRVYFIVENPKNLTTKELALNNNKIIMKKNSTKFQAEQYQKILKRFFDENLR